MRRLLPALLLLVACAPDEPPGVAATLDGVALRLEVADSAEERARGLMGRTSLPERGGMVFLYDEPVEVRFYMYDVPIPLTAVFVRDGRVVQAIEMRPCEQDRPEDCPTYGPDEPFDTVVEVAPGTLPDVAPGDRFSLDA
jgi:uncharacterized membrane protein (UPF0127 family)